MLHLIKPTVKYLVYGKNKHSGQNGASDCRIIRHKSEQFDYEQERLRPGGYDG